MSQQQETKLSTKCINYLKQLKSQGHFIYWEHRTGGGGFNYRKGIPDLFVVINSIHIEVELKTPTGKRSSMQDKWAYIFQENHIHYTCPKSFEDFKKFIDDFL